MRRFWILIATGLGTGYAPIASGTVGTLVGIPAVYFIDKYYPHYMLLVAAVVLFFIGTRAAAVAEWWFEESDSHKIVIDEIVGYMLAMYLVPVSAKTLIIAFFLFRFFDIAKIWPAKYFDLRPGPWAVMLDDVCAGIYSNIAIHLLFWFGWVKW